MSGGGSTRTNQTSSSTTNQNTNVTTPGTGFGMDVLGDVQNADLQGDILAQQPYTGPRVAAPQDQGAGNYAAQYGPTPSTFVPQRSATDAPIQVTQTHVDPNYQPAITAGINQGASNQTAIGGQTNDLYNYWSGITSGGGQNPYLEPVISAFTQDFDEQSARAQGRRAQMAGAEGAFGGTPYAQNEAWQAEQEADVFGRTVSGLRYQDFLNTQGLMERAPGALRDIADTSTYGVDQQLHYGGLQQENLAAAAAAGDYNAQVLQNNLHQAQSLNDANAIAAAQDEIQRWEANYAREQGRVADIQGREGARQEIEQAGYTNALFQNNAQAENIQRQLQQLSELLGLSRAVPGASTQTTGTAHGTSSSRTREDTGVDWGAIASIAGAAIMAMSDVRMKKNIQFHAQDRRGVKWYYFHYLWQQDNEEPQFGVMAQELFEIAPQFVYDNNGVLVVDYTGLARWRRQEVA